MANLGFIGCCALSFYAGGAVAFYQLVSVLMGNQGSTIPLIARIWVGLTWPFSSYLWGPRGDDDSADS